MFKVLLGFSTGMLLDQVIEQTVMFVESDVKWVTVESSAGKLDCCIIVLRNWEVEREDKSTLFIKLTIIYSFVSSQKKKGFSID